MEKIKLHGIATISREGDTLRVVGELRFIEEHMNTTREKFFSEEDIG
ncbi:MAG: hypothetical protein QW463_01270 [Candidatus Caldarchaeum sp.]